MHETTHLAYITKPWLEVKGDGIPLCAQSAFRFDPKSEESCYFLEGGGESWDCHGCCLVIKQMRDRSSEAKPEKSVVAIVPATLWHSSFSAHVA